MPLIENIGDIFITVVQMFCVAWEGVCWPRFEAGVCVRRHCNAGHLLVFPRHCSGEDVYSFFFHRGSFLVNVATCCW